MKEPLKEISGDFDTPELVEDIRIATNVLIRDYNERNGEVQSRRIELGNPPEKWKVQHITVPQPPPEGSEGHDEPRCGLFSCRHGIGVCPCKCHSPASREKSCPACDSAVERDGTLAHCENKECGRSFALPQGDSCCAKCVSDADGLEYEGSRQEAKDEIVTNLKSVILSLRNFPCGFAQVELEGVIRKVQSLK